MLQRRVGVLRAGYPHAACGQAKPGAWATKVWGYRHGLFVEVVVTPYLESIT